MRANDLDHALVLHLIKCIVCNCRWMCMLNMFNCSLSKCVQTFDIIHATFLFTKRDPVISIICTNNVHCVNRELVMICICRRWFSTKLSCQQFHAVFTPNIRRLESNSVLTGFSWRIGRLLNVIELEIIGTIEVWLRNEVGIQDSFCI